MANYYSSQGKTLHSRIFDRVTVDIGDHTVEGGGVVWVTSSTVAGQTDTITVRNYDRSRYGEYTERFQPHVVIKCDHDASGGTACAIKDEAGTTLYTFNTDCSSTPKYVVLRLDSTDAWELA